MANVKISQLTAASALAATDLFEIASGGASYSATAQKIADFLASVSQTLTNKTFDTAGTGNSFKINGTAVSAVTGTGSVVLATNPTLTAPTLGVATGTSLAIGGATIGTNALAVTGTAFINGNAAIGSAPQTSANLYLSRSITGAVSSYGLRNSSAIQSDVTTAASVNYSQPTTQAAAFTLSALNHYIAVDVVPGSGSVVANQYAFRVGTLTGATTNYAFYGGVAQATGAYNLYMAGTAPNYLGGTLSLGTNSSTLYALRVGLDVTGGTSGIGVYGQPVFLSDVTGSGTVFRSTPATAAAAFTMSTLTHFTATSTNIGANSAITTQYGFWAQAALTGATNNYGFFHNLASATGVWGFYGSGTAPNYFGGATTIAAALTYGGVTLSNSVTGTGSMVLSASPTFTGTVTTAGLTVGSGSALKLGNAFVAGAPAATGYVTIQDSSGTTYKVLVST